jgi:hypothetical protein
MTGTLSTRGADLAGVLFRVVETSATAGPQRDPAGHRDRRPVITLAVNGRDQLMSRATSCVVARSAR